MFTRRIVAVAAAALVTVGLVPASAAFAQDDLVCLQEETRQTTVHFETTVVHFCARWLWVAPTITVTPSTPTDDNPDGGKGGTPDKDGRTCTSIEQQIAEVREQLELIGKQIPAAETWVRDVNAREAAAKQKGYDASRAWSDAADNVDFWYTAYVGYNDLEVEVEIERKNGVTIVRPVAGFRPNLSLEFGFELLHAMNEEAAARAARDQAAHEYLAVVAEQTDAQEAYNNLVARQSALSQLLERLRAQVSLGRCVK